MNEKPVLMDSMKERMAAIAAKESVKKALQVCYDEADYALEEQIKISEIESPTFAEGVRAEAFAGLLKQYGLKDVVIDESGIVVGRRPGKGNGPVVAIAAHLDTVFPAGTPLKVRREGDTLYGPGIGDDASGLRSVLQTLRALEKAGIETEGDILFVGTVGEEGNGDIRGSKALFDGSRKIDGFIGVDMADVHTVQNGATGAHRWRLAIEGEGGHSYVDYGKIPSAIHAMCRAGAKIADMELPEDPKTTYTIGTIKGGTTVNSIAAHCEVDVDLRSVNVEELDKLEKFVLGCFEKAVEEENAHWVKAEPKNHLKLVKTQIGNRPAGMRPADCPVVQAALGAMDVLGLEVKRFGPSSTDANKPMSMNIPATCIGTGGVCCNEHSLKEYFIADKIWLGPQTTVLAVLALVGMDGEKGALA